MCYKFCNVLDFNECQQKMVDNDVRSPAPPSPHYGRVGGGRGAHEEPRNTSGRGYGRRDWDRHAGDGPQHHRTDRRPYRGQ